MFIKLLNYFHLYYRILKKYTFPINIKFKERKEKNLNIEFQIFFFFTVQYSIEFYL